MLRNASGFARSNLRAADVVEQGRLAVVDVPHDGHDRRARLQLRLVMLGRGLGEQGFRIVELGRLGGVPHLGDHDHRGVLVEHLVDGHHAAHLHERLDDLGGFHRHLVGEIADGDGLGHHDLAHQRLGGRGELRRALHRGSAGLVPCAPLGRVPAGSALHVAAGLDGASLDAFVLPDLDLLGLLRALLLGSGRDLGLCSVVSPAAGAAGALASAGFCSAALRSRSCFSASSAAWRAASSSCLRCSCSRSSTCRASIAAPGAGGGASAAGPGSTRAS